MGAGHQVQFSRHAFFIAASRGLKSCVDKHPCQLSVFLLIRGTVRQIHVLRYPLARPGKLGVLNK